MICPMLSALKPTDDNGNPVDRECIYENCRFFNIEVRDCTLMMASRAMGAIGFKLFLTTTLNRGHVNGLGEGEVLILPVTARDEEWSPTTQESMFNYVRMSDGGPQRHVGPRSEVDIIAELAEQTDPRND